MDSITITLKKTCQELQYEPITIEISKTFEITSPKTPEAQAEILRTETKALEAHIDRFIEHRLKVVAKNNPETLVQ